MFIKCLIFIKFVDFVFIIIGITFTFYKVVYREYSVEVGNVYITLWQMYSGYYTPNCIRVVQVL